MKKIIICGCFVTASIAAYGQFWKTTEPTKLGGDVNTAAEESIPIFSKDSSTLYYVRTFDKANRGDENDQDIWYAKRSTANVYETPERLVDLNDKYNNAVLGINNQGTAMYVFNTYDGKKDYQKGLARSAYADGKWGEATKVEIASLDIDGDFYGFHVSGDEEVVIISYAGPNTVGEEDLYVSVKQGNGYSTPIHMGKTINSTGFEIAPFLSPNKDTLFFSSNGFGGEGDADIFFSVRQGAWDSWSEPVNLGAPINSPKFDAYFTYSDNQAYWSSNRDSELSDIWMVHFLTPPPVYISCTSQNISAFGMNDGQVSASIEGGEGPYSYKWSNGATTQQIMGLSAGEYTVTVVDANGMESSSSCTVVEPAQPPVPQEVSMKHYFGYNAHALSVSEGELGNFLNGAMKILNTGKETVTIVINSSASNVRTTTFANNQKLAERRAKSMEETLMAYFEEKGFGDRIKIEIESAKVQGPKYEGDFNNQEKYQPYQYIELQTK